MPRRGVRRRSNRSNSSDNSIVNDLKEKKPSRKKSKKKDILSSTNVNKGELYTGDITNVNNHTCPSFDNPSLMNNMNQQRFTQDTNFMYSPSPNPMFQLQNQQLCSTPNSGTIYPMQQVQHSSPVMQYTSQQRPVWVDELFQRMDTFENKLDKLEKVGSLVTSLNAKVVKLEVNAKEMDGRLEQVEKSTQLISNNFDKVGSFKTELDKVSKQMKSRTTFQGLSQEALQSCIASLKIAKEGIIKRKTKTDGQLFLVKHLLILREQIAPFHADFTIRETSLDFSKFKDAAYGLMHSKSKLFQFNSNNAVLQFILEGTPQVTEYFVDSKRDVDQELKKTCEEYIHYVTELFISPLQMFLSRANVVISMKSEENIKSVSLSSQPFATPEKIHDIVAETYKNMKTQLVSVHRSMALYLANRDTEIILFKPVKVNIQNSFQQLYKILDEYYTEEDQQIVATPSIEQINLLLSTSAKN
ncbi:conserved oligomeric Golgi complex subunit 3 [Mytilus galloprovincialis]|uniref:Conserved oligomeric Golgi complex subunit 3 n=1 Tax=Mytilus galloprovincialis TaxID=29158 RepID=A0A8B6BSA0_MYTGA|nr:conserved oligomeric Golgi complex subunit 3 [Mytilus galloprovincialis]